MAMLARRIGLNLAGPMQPHFDSLTDLFSQQMNNLSLSMGVERVVRNDRDVQVQIGSLLDLKLSNGRLFPQDVNDRKGMRKAAVRRSKHVRLSPFHNVERF